MYESVLKISDVTKIFTKDSEQVRAVDSVNLDVAKGEFITFLGPSGCGKTTTLRMVAGFELPTSGSITIQGMDMTNVPVNKRGIGFVFQNYALFPHMSVFQNVAYGLKARGEKDVDIASKVHAALELVGLTNTENRFPTQLSGGEQQRVALARVIVMEPSLLLMDEPLSNLDAKLRIHMRTEIRRLQKHLGITCLYVTHDQSEALAMADRIVVMNKGKVEQVGTPFEIYSNPQSLFVADFIGSANIIRMPVTAYSDSFVSAQIPGGGTYTAQALKVKEQDKLDFILGSTAALICRPETITISDAVSTGFPATVRSTVFGGSTMDYELSLVDDAIIKAAVPYQKGMKVYAEGDKVDVIVDEKNAIFLPI